MDEQLQVVILDGNGQSHEYSASEDELHTIFTLAEVMPKRWIGQDPTILAGRLYQNIADTQSLTLLDNPLK